MSGSGPSDANDGGFQFIVSSGPRLDPASRKTIRRQAMKDIGLSRRRENRNQTKTKQLVNRTQPPVLEELPGRPNVAVPSESPSSSFLTSEESGRSTPSTEPTELDDTETLLIGHDHDPYNDRMTLYSPRPAKGEYEYLRSNSAIDLSSLTILTNFNIGKSTISTLASSSSRLPIVFSHQQWSYLDYIPQRYSHSPYLAAATDCILAKVAHVLSPRSGGEDSVLRLYAKALRLVQGAVASSSCTDPDVLCAVQLLSLHELFDVSRSEAWASHVEGSSRLIKYRSAKRFETEFEKALFAASVGPYVSQCLYNGKHCYLAEPPWRQLYMSLAVHTDHLTDRSELVLGLRSQMFTLPGLWRDIGSALQGEDLFDDDVLSSLAKRCRESQMGYLKSLEDYKDHVVRSALVQPSSSEIALRRELYGLAHEGLILVKRLQASVCDADRLTLEAEVRSVAQSIFDLQEQPVPQHSWLFSGHELGVAQLALSTTDLFTEDVSIQCWEDQRIAMRTRYLLWSGSLRAF